MLCNSTNVECRNHKIYLQDRAQTIPKFSVDDHLRDDHAMENLASRLSLAPPDALQSTPAIFSKTPTTTASLVVCKICSDLTGSKRNLNRERVTYHMNAKFVSILFSQNLSDIGPSVILDTIYMKMCSTWSVPLLKWRESLLRKSKLSKKALAELMIMHSFQPTDLVTRQIQTFGKFQQYEGMWTSTRLSAIHTEWTGNGLDPDPRC